jgi:hypothetical protein
MKAKAADGARGSARWLRQRPRMATRSAATSSSPPRESAHVTDGYGAIGKPSAAMATYQSVALNSSPNLVITWSTGLPARPRVWE